MNHTQQHPLWSRLRDAGLVEGDEMSPREDTPWYLAALIGVSAWVAAAFLFGFFMTVFDRLFSNGALAIAIGASCCTVALVLLQMARGRDFIEQFAIAAALAGQVLIGMGLSDVFESRSGEDAWRLIWSIVAAVAMLMYALGRLSMHRFLCGLIFAWALVGFCALNRANPEAVFALPLLAWSAAAGWWFAADRHRLSPAAPPLAWALSLVALWFVGFFEDPIGVTGATMSESSPWRLYADIAILPLLPACAAWLTARRASQLPPARRAAIVAVAVVFALLWSRAPGVSIGVALAMTGFALYRPALLVVGVGGLAIYLANYYYQLQIPLLHKAYWLLAGGASLLLARAAYLRLAREETA